MKTTGTSVNEIAFGSAKWKRNTLVYCYLIIHVIENSCMHQETGLLLNHMLRFEKKKKKKKEKKKRKLKSFKGTCSEHINMRG